MNISQAKKMQELLAAIEEQQRELNQAKYGILSQLSELENATSEYHLAASNKKSYQYVNCETLTDANVEKLRKEYHHCLQLRKRYHLVTITVDPSILKHHSHMYEDERLKNIIYAFDDTQYFACLEKHTNGRLHAHILLVYDPIKLKEKLMKHLKAVSPKRTLFPAITMKPVEKTSDDLNKAYAYIFKHKADHPLYKDLFINI